MCRFDGRRKGRWRRSETVVGRGARVVNDLCRCRDVSDRYLEVATESGCMVWRKIVSLISREDIPPSERAGFARKSGEIKKFVTY